MTASSIDAHHHFWDPTRGDYGWMDDLDPAGRERLVRSVGPSELAPHLERHGIARAIVVQAAPTEAEGRYLLEVSRRCDFVAGAVVWLDLERDDFAERLRAFRQEPGFLGVRPMVQDLADPRWLLRPPVRRALAELERTRTCFDFLVKPPQMAAMLEVLDQFENLAAVIDHVAKPAIARRELDPWREQMRQAARHPNVYCKLSGMVTEADHQSWTPADLEPYVRHVVETFGPERCMFGSDWPVCTLAASYDQVVAALEENLDRVGLSAAQRERIFCATAAEFYRI